MVAGVVKRGRARGGDLWLELGELPPWRVGASVAEDVRGLVGELRGLARVLEEAVGR